MMGSIYLAIEACWLDPFHRFSPGSSTRCRLSLDRRCSFCSSSSSSAGRRNCSRARLPPPDAHQRHQSLLGGLDFLSCFRGAALSNPHASWVAAVGILFAGLFLALGYLRTGQLWLSIGLHIGLELFEGSSSASRVSGTASYPLLRIQVSGPPLWTGAAFGPEAGLIVMPAILFGALLILLYSRRHSPSKE